MSHQPTHRDPAQKNLALVRPTDPVSAIMRSPVASVDEDVSIREVIETLVAGDIGAVAVTRRDRPLGIISERDLISYFAGNDDLDNTTATDVMTADLLVVSSDEPIIEAARRASAAGIRHLPVADTSGELVGMLSVRDLLSVLIASV